MPRMCQCPARRHHQSQGRHAASAPRCARPPLEAAPTNFPPFCCHVWWNPTCLSAAATPVVGQRPPHWLRQCKWPAWSCTGPRSGPEWCVTMCSHRRRPQRRRMRCRHWRSTQPGGPASQCEDRSTPSQVRSSRWSPACLVRAIGCRCSLSSHCADYRLASMPEWGTMSSGMLADGTSSGRPRGGMAWHGCPLACAAGCAAVRLPTAGNVISA